MAKYAFKLSTMVGENFDIHFYQMTKNEKVLKFPVLKWLKLHSHCPLWLEGPYPTSRE